MKRFALFLMAAGILTLVTIGTIIKHTTHVEAATVSSEPTTTPEIAMPTPERRRAFAEVTENAYLASGKDVHISVAGKDATTIIMKYVLIDRPSVYQFNNNAELIGNLKDLGFRKAILTDGYDHSWTVDLTRSAS